MQSSLHLLIHHMTTDDVQDIDSNHLTQLEQRLLEAEQEIINANLDQRINSLRAARDTQQEWMRSYEVQIEKLKKDVANVQEIRYAIPESCFRRVRLEP